MLGEDTPSPLTASSPKRYFASYSSADRAFVQPVVRLLRTTSTLVFLDVDSIDPGERWADRLEQAIAEATTFVLFWSRHARKSPIVEREWRAALNAGKEIIPVYIDSTVLPEPLQAFQGVHFKSLVPKPPLRSTVALGCLGVIAVAALATFEFDRRRTSDSSHPWGAPRKYTLPAGLAYESGSPSTAFEDLREEIEEAQCQLADVTYRRTLLLEEMEAFSQRQKAAMSNIDSLRQRKAAADQRLAQAIEAERATRLAVEQSAILRTPAGTPSPLTSPPPSGGLAARLRSAQQDLEQARLESEEAARLLMHAENSYQDMLRAERHNSVELARLEQLSNQPLIFYSGHGHGEIGPGYPGGVVINRMARFLSEDLGTIGWTPIAARPRWYLIVAGSLGALLCTLLAIFVLQKRRRPNVVAAAEHLRQSLLSA
jgi:hypothetical protein